jgi:DNA-binding LytR/AlgR family response regulator
MIRVLAIDDEPLALQQLVTYISKVPFLELAGQCQSALEAKEILDSEPVDAIFCDINMPDLNGMDFVKSLYTPPLIVFTTAYAEYAVEGFKVDAVDYLLKPFGLDEFRRAANRLQNRLTPVAPATLSDQPLHSPKNAPNDQTTRSAMPLRLAKNTTNDQTTDTLFIKTDYRVVKIAVADIRYVEGMSEYLKLHVEGQPKPIITLMAMKKLEERLPDNFMRIHRSYIVNLDKIKEVNKNRIILSSPALDGQAEGQKGGSDINLPIGDNYKEQFSQYLTTRLLGK